MDLHIIIIIDRSVFHPSINWSHSRLPQAISQQLSHLLTPVATTPQCLVNINTFLLQKRKKVSCFDHIMIIYTFNTITITACHASLPHPQLTHWRIKGPRLMVFVFNLHGSIPVLVSVIDSITILIVAPPPAPDISSRPTQSNKSCLLEMETQ